MKIIYFFIFMFSQFAFSQINKCISLEGVHLGCVSAQNHPCIRLVVKNKEEGGPILGPSQQCYFIERIEVEYRNPNVGPLAMNCQSWKPGFNPDAPGETAFDKNSMCDVFQRPTCAVTCRLCAPEIKSAASLPSIDKGCEILSDGSGTCTGACRGRCGDEPFAGGVKHADCGGSRRCSVETTACKARAPQCPATYPGSPGVPGYIPPTPADPAFLSTKDAYPQCSNTQLCPRAVNYRGDGIDPPPPPGSTDCARVDTGALVPRQNGNCPCLPGPRAANGFCPPGSVDSTPITEVIQPSNPTPVAGQGGCPVIPEIMPQVGDEGLSCPWVKAFGISRRNCEAIPCICQFDPATGAAKTKAQCGGTFNSCEEWLDGNIPCCCQMNPSTGKLRTDCPDGCAGGCPDAGAASVNSTPIQTKIGK